MLHHRYAGSYRGAEVSGVRTRLRTGNIPRWQSAGLGAPGSGAGRDPADILGIRNQVIEIRTGERSI